LEAFLTVCSSPSSAVQILRGFASRFVASRRGDGGEMVDSLRRAHAPCPTSSECDGANLTSAVFDTSKGRTHVSARFFEEFLALNFVRQIDACGIYTFDAEGV